MANGKSQTVRCFKDIILHNNDVLAALYKHSLDIIKIQNIIKNHLGTPLSEHCYVANFSRESLSIMTDSPVWATRLRFQTAEILNLARNIPELKGLQSIRIRIKPRPYSDADHEKPSTVSPETSRLLTRVAENTDDIELKTALLKIAGTD